MWLLGDGEAGIGLIGGQVGDGQAKMVSWEKDRRWTDRYGDSWWTGWRLTGRCVVSW